MQYPELRDEEWLRLQYWGWGKTSQEIGSELGCTGVAVNQAMRRLGLERRPRGYHREPMYRLRNPGMLAQWYVEGRMGASEMARLLGCGPNTVLDALRRLGVSIRSKSEAVHIERCPDAELVLSDEALDVLNGELLGDGSLDQRSPFSARYQHNSQYWDYLYWLSNRMEAFGLEQAGRIRECSNGHGGTNWSYSTRTYPVLADAYANWYPEGTKIVPEDLVLSPLVVAHWFLGDGSFHQGRARSLMLHTQGFSPGDRSLLVDKLADIEVKATVQGKGCLRVRNESLERFFDYMGPSPVPCYSYKWPEGES